MIFSRGDNMWLRYFCGSCLAVASIIYCRTVTAVDTNLMIRGNILDAGCIVTGSDDNGVIDVSFGEININKVGTPETERLVNLKVSCDNSVQERKTLQMYVHPTSYGILTSVGQNVLETSLPGLGIALTVGTDAKPVNLNTWTPVPGMSSKNDTWTRSVKIQARLVTPSKSQLQAGKFKATADIIMNYQ